MFSLISLTLHFKITKEDVGLAEKELDDKGKFEIWHTVKAVNKKGVVCAKAKILTYLRDDQMKQKLGFLDLLISTIA